MAHVDSEPTVARRITHTMTILRSPRDVYKAWRDLESVPAFMENVIRVDEEATRSHRIVKAAADAVEWDAYLVADVPAELIAWRSTPGADVANSGEVRFQRTAHGRLPARRGSPAVRQYD